jgi:hypothetical protein
LSKSMDRVVGDYRLELRGEDRSGRQQFGLRSTQVGDNPSQPTQDQWDNLRR